MEASGESPRRGSPDGKDPANHRGPALRGGGRLVPSSPVSALGIAAASILVNPGVRWNRFFLMFGIVALAHASAFGAVALRWGSSLGLVPELEEIINDRDLFGKEDDRDAGPGEK